MSLDVEVGIKNARFRAGLEQMRGQAKQFSGDLKGMFIGAFSIAAVTAFAEKMREVQKEALRFGTSAESIQRVGKAAKMSDVDFGMLAKSINKVTLEAGKAARGGAEQARMFQLLGIDAKKFVGMSLDEKLLALSTAFKESQSSGMKTSAMLDLIGERGSEIIPLLARGPGELSRSMQEATVQTTGTVAAFANLDRQLQKLKGNSAKWLAATIGGIRNVVAYAAAYTNAGKYDDAAQTDLDTENMRRKHAGEKQITGSDAKTWVSKRANEMLENDVQGGLKDSEKPEEDPHQQADDFTQDQGRNSKEALATLNKQITEDEAKNRADALSGQAKINELNSQRAALAKTIGKDEAANLEIKKQDLALEREIAEVRKSQAEKLQAAKEKQADVREKLAMAQMTPQQKVAYLQGKQKRLEDEAAQIDNAPAIVEAKRKQAARADADAKASADEATRAKQNDPKARVEAENDKYASRRRSAQLNLDADRIERESTLDKAVEKRTEAMEIGSQIEALKKEGSKDGDKAAGAPDEKKKPFTVLVDNLQRAGGGGRAYGTSVDPALRAQTRAADTLDKILSRLPIRADANPTRTSRPEPY